MKLWLLPLGMALLTALVAFVGIWWPDAGIQHRLYNTAGLLTVLTFAAMVVAGCLYDGGYGDD